MGIIKEPGKLGRKGGKATLAKYGPDHFTKLAKRRWRKVRAQQKGDV